MTLRTRTILLAARDLVTPGMVTYAMRADRGGGQTLSHTRKAGHGNPFPADRIRRPCGPNEAPRSYRPPR